MTERRILFALVFFFSYLFCASSFLFKKYEHKKAFNICISPEELKLYNEINNYRRQHKLPAIPLSKSLSYVAQQHVIDLADYHPDNGKCNSHSWSNNGKWKGCCYSEDHANATCMWSKPSELTNYRSNGFEIACTGAFNAEEILNRWKGSHAHNQVILNQNIWKRMKWNSIGIGINKEYAVVWFGEAEDPEGKPLECKTSTLPK